MATAKRSEISLHTLRRKTAALEKASADVGDPFLQSMYGVVLHHLEEQLGIRGREQSESSLSDPQIARMAAKLVASAKSGG